MEKGGTRFERREGFGYFLRMERQRQGDSAEEEKNTRLKERKKKPLAKKKREVTSGRTTRTDERKDLIFGDKKNPSLY